MFDETLMSIVDNSEVAEMRLNSTSASQPDVQGRMLLMPMSDDLGNITRVFGGITVDVPVVHPPLRFEITDVRTKRIVTGQETEAPSRAVGFAEDSAPFLGRPSQADLRKTVSGNKPYLRLVKNE
jgi:hypothetical protein